MYNMNKPTTKSTLSITPNTPAAGAASLLPVAGPAAIAPVAIAGGGVLWVRGALMRCFTSAAVLLVLAFSATGASAQTVTINPQGSGGANVRTFDAGTSLTLTAASISGLSSPFVYAWQPPNAAGTPAGVTFSRRDQSTFTITASPSVLNGTTFGIRLEVSGSTSAGPAVNSASITIRNNNQSPTAAVGPNQTVNEGTRVTLLGSGNDPDGNNADLDYFWMQTGGPDVTLSNATVAQPTFTVPDIPPSASAPTLFIFTLRVRDAAYPATNQSTATARIFIRPLFQETIDNQSYPAGNEIMELTLPTALSVTGGTNTYTLSPVPPGLSLNNRILSGTPTGTMRTQTFNNLTYTATGSGGTDTLSFSITVTNAPPTGAPTISGDPTEGEELTATANTTIINDANGFEVVSEGVPPEFTYQWNRRNGTTDTPISGETSATYTLTTADIGEQITVTASFTDGGGRQESRTSIATAAVRAANEPPVASAGSNQTVNEGATVTLDGSGTTDPDIANGDVLTYAWTQTSGTPVTLNDTSVVSPTFTAPVRQTMTDGNLMFTLTVTDSENETSTATVTISVTNLPPVADAGENQTVNEVARVTLDGSGSSGLAGDGRTYAWTQTGGTTVTLNDASAISPTFIAPVRQTEDDEQLLFTLTVTDAAGGSDEDIVVISVTILPPIPIPVSPADDDALQLVNEDGSLVENLTVVVSETREVIIEGGSPPFFVVSEISETTQSAIIEDRRLRIIGLSAGEAQLLIRDIRGAFTPLPLRIKTLPPLLNLEADDGTGTEALFRGGASSDGGVSYSLDGSFSVDETLDVLLTIAPRSADVGVQANVVIAARNASVPETVWLLTQSGLVTYDDETLVPFQENLVLEANHFMDLTPEPITLTMDELGNWELFVGYQLGSGDLFYHMIPLSVEVLE